MKIPTLTDIQLRILLTAFTVAVIGGGGWYIYHRGEVAAKGKFETAVNKSNAVVKQDLGKAAVKVEQKFTPRAAFREGVAENFGKQLEDHEKTVEQNKAAGASVATGISDNGLRLINEAIDCRERESRSSDNGKVPPTSEAERERGRKGCALGG